MQNDVVAATVKAVMPTSDNSYAVFLGNEEKTFVIYVDPYVGNAIQMGLDGVKKHRPLTHDLIGSILLGLGTKLERIVINDAHDQTFFARILLKMENELRDQDRRDRRAPERLDRPRPPAQAPDLCRPLRLRQCRGPDRHP